ncbi:hypothetical protein SAMN02745165_00874 [Malonomonas rubra DSM 5091]|uniref:Tetratricopeptide repeat-containing protein n=1 Tax=Malonomonas rubra DSM 5091 TaxID=1122189 RepID=A0A1M6E064_MALRU|nr:hypothetical protein [Malonomonas rubra]SHI78658.1 hypothetical protein SAMN02745165_00874 [Malonomonas rubra DSM 5091]
MIRFFFQAGLTIICRPGLRVFIPLFLLLLLTGCAGRLEKASELFHAEQPEAALAELEKGDIFGGRNRLLFLLERGTVLHQLGRYRESSEALLQAADLLQSYEQLGISEQVGSLVTTEWLTRYKGEYSERLWVHSYQMMNFLLLGEYDSAYVEARRAVELYQRYPQALKNDFFSRGLIALCFATVGEENDAYLVYRQLADDLPGPAPVVADLLRISSRLGQRDDVERYQGLLPPNLPAADGELVLFIANGRIPEKMPGNIIVPPSIRFSFPYYETSHAALAQVVLSPASPMLPPLSTSLGEVARQSLDQRKLQLIAKETARVAAKEAISQKVGKDYGPTAEAVARISLLLLEEPDTRSWQTLPGRLTLVRVPLLSGQHMIRVRLQGRGEVKLPEFQLRKGQKVFFSLRF